MKEISDIKPVRISPPNNRDIVIFIIGMKIQQWWKIRSWGKVFFVMSKMLKELYSMKASGLLHHEIGLSGRNIVLIQYWTSLKSLHDYAYEKTHAKAWAGFYKTAANAKGIDFFHETYFVKAEHYESIEVNLNKPRGLACA